MRTLAFTFLAVLASATWSAAQDTASSSDTGQAEAPTGIAPRRSALQAGIDYAGRWLGGAGSTRKDGWYPDLTMVTGAGWISAGPGYRVHLFDGNVLVDASAALSWREYKNAAARVELPTLAAGRVTAGAQARWQDFTQVNYFGRGPESLESARSEFRLKSTDVLAYGAVRAGNGVSVAGRFGWLDRPTLASPAGTFDRDFPNALTTFAAEPGVNDPTSYLHGDLTVSADSRDHQGHPTKGALYRASAGFYSDRDLGRYSFRRYETEGLQVVPLAGSGWLVALHGWAVFSDTSPGNDVPFYLLPSLGGTDTLRGYHDFRFHDRDMLLASAESRWAVARQIDAAVFVDSGDVAPRVADLDLARVTYGAGVRVHSHDSTIGRLDVGRGTEGWRVFVSIADPFAVRQRGERRRVTPFVP